MLIKGLNKEYNEEEIKTRIEALKVPDITVTKVIPITFTRSRENDTVISFNHHLVQLAPGSKAGNLFKVSSLAHQAVKWEYFRRSSVFQCHNCQRFGHTSRHCGFEYRCVKCDTSHKPGECPRTKDPTVKEASRPHCVNCGERGKGHTANFRGCPVLREAQKGINEWKRATAETKNHGNYQKYQVNKNYSFANITANNRGRQHLPSSAHLSYYNYPPLKRAFPQIAQTSAPATTPTLAPTHRTTQDQGRHIIELVEAVGTLTEQVKLLNNNLSELQNQITSNARKIEFILANLKLKYGGE